MKKALFTLVALISMMAIHAQQKWDFTVTPDADSTALAKASSEWTATKSGTINRFESINAIDGAIKAGGKELTMTKGLTVSGAAAKKIRIDVNNRLQLAVLNGTQQFVHSLIFTSLLEVLEKDVCVEENFHSLYFS